MHCKKRYFHPFHQDQEPLQRQHMLVVMTILFYLSKTEICSQSRLSSTTKSHQKIRLHFGIFPFPKVDFLFLFKKKKNQKETLKAVCLI